MPWAPKTDFEDEYVSAQPNHDFIFGSLSVSAEDDHYPRPESHLRFIEERKKKHKEQKNINCSSKNSKLKIIAKMQRIAGTKPLGEQPTLEDWDDDTNVERETIAMMRHLGLQESVDVPLTEECTIATFPLTEEMLIMHNGTKRMPILYNDKFFKLKSRIPFEFKHEEDTTEEHPQQSIASQSITDEGGLNDKSDSKSTASGNQEFGNEELDCSKSEDHYETPDGSLIKEDSDFGSTGNDTSYNTACSQSFISSRSSTRSNKHLSSESSKDGANNDKHRKSQKVLDGVPYLTTKELYLKKRKH